MTDFFDTSPVDGLVVQYNDGPIIGNPEPLVHIGAGGILSTQLLTQGEVGDLSYLANFAIEFWFRFWQGNPGQDRLLVRGPQGSNASPFWQWTLGTTGSAHNQPYITVGEASSFTQFTATSSIGIASEIWHHLVFQTRSGHLCVHVDGIKYADSTSWGSSVVKQIAPEPYDTTLRLLGPASSAPAHHFSNLAIYRGSLSDARVQAHYLAGTVRGFNQQSADARINSALDSIGSSAPRSFLPGSRSVTPRFMAGALVTDAIDEAVSAEAVDAGFFVGADGTLRFLGAGHRSSAPHAVVQATFGDAGPPELPYLEYESDNSDSFIANEWNVTRQGTDKAPGATITASDAASISRYKKRSQSISGIPVPSDSDSSAIAAAMLAKYKEPMERISSISPDMSDPDTIAATYALEIGDRVECRRTPPGGGARIVQQLFVQKIEHSHEPSKPPTCRLTVTPL